jgi:hypothetical protein
MAVVKKAKRWRFSTVFPELCLFGMKNSRKHSKLKDTLLVMPELKKERSQVLNALVALHSGPNVNYQIQKNTKAKTFVFFYKKNRSYYFNSQSS